MVAGAFNSADINATPAGLTTTVTAGSAYSITGGGTGVYNAADSCRFVYTQLTGNFDIAVQVTSLSALSGAYPQAGLMARADLTASSLEAAITASPVGGYRAKSRTTVGAATTQVETDSTVSAVFPSVWVRLQRIGNAFRSYYSTTGTNWIEVSNMTVNLSTTSPILVGMVVASDSATASTMAQFQNLTGA